MVKLINQELFNDILALLTNNRLTGSELYAKLKHKHVKLSKRLVYHYLYLGVEKGYLKVEARNELGDFSWGKSVTKKYYTINLTK